MTARTTEQTTGRTAAAPRGDTFHVAWLHVPLGVVMFALSTLVLGRSPAPRSPVPAG